MITVLKNGTLSFQNVDTLKVEKFLKTQQSLREEQVRAATGCKTLYKKNPRSGKVDRQFEPPELEYIKWEIITTSEKTAIKEKIVPSEDKKKQKLFKDNFNRISLDSFENYIKALDFY